MAIYSVRLKQTKEHVCVIRASSDEHLFQMIDEYSDPFSYEYCKTTYCGYFKRNESPVWLTFKDYSYKLVEKF